MFLTKDEFDLFHSSPTLSFCLLLWVDTTKSPDLEHASLQNCEPILFYFYFYFYLLQITHLWCSVIVGQSRMRQAVISVSTDIHVQIESTSISFAKMSSGFKNNHLFFSKKPDKINF